MNTVRVIQRNNLIEDRVKTFNGNPEGVLTGFQISARGTYAMEKKADDRV
jgi:hypothetical protein